MKQFIKQIDGKTVTKTRKQIVIRKDGMQTINPTEEMILADGWVEYMVEKDTVPQESVELSDEQQKKATLVSARHAKRNEILNYDKSAEVNGFYVGELQMWLDKATRAGLLLRFQAEQAQGIIDTALWYNGLQFSLRVDQAIQMLYAIELYASACYDNTQRHLAAVKQLKTIEEVEAYDYTTGYPEKLRF